MKSIKWTKQSCFELASKYTSFRLFTTENRGAYKAARKNGWISEYTWLEKYSNVDLTKKLWSIYVYEISNKYAYIGLSRTLNERVRVHEKDKRDLLFKFCKDNNLILDKPIIKYNNLDAYEASSLEDKTKLQYKNSGWIVINKAKTGIGSSSLGGGVKKWTEKSCESLAKLCKTLSEFKKKSGSAYNSARKNGWLKNYTWLSNTGGRRKIVQYDLMGNLIKNFNSLADASISIIGSKNGFTNIQAVCCGKARTSYGYIWRYREDVLDENGEVLKKIDIKKRD